MSAVNATRQAGPLLEAASLTVRFGSLTALDGLELSAPPGEVLAILGPNGAGKTTFVRAVATLVRPSAGTLRVLGIDVARDPAAVRREIGLAGQFAAVEPKLSGRENLELSARLFGHRRRAAREAASRVIETLGLEEVADRRCSTYSGGQRRRLDLGASLVGAPRLLLLDEPTTGLDPASRREVWDAVRALVASGTDVLLTTHYLDEANELAGRIVVIDRGRTIAAGTLAELRASVGREVIELSVADPSRLDEAGRIVGRVAAQPPRFDRSGRRIAVSSAGGAGGLAAVIAALEQAALPIEEIGLRRPTLDEVFLTLTGAGHEPAPGGLPGTGSRR